MSWQDALASFTSDLTSHRTSIFDTGSGFLVVACTACTAALNCPAEVQKFNPNKSSTFTNDNIPLNAVYDTGVGVAPSDREEQNGIIGNDTLCVAGLCVSNLIFGVVNNQTAGLNANAFGGVLGMSPPAIGDNISNVIEFFPALAFMNKVHEKRFGFFLEPRKDDDGAGELTLGGIDETKLKSEIHFLPINRQVIFPLKQPFPEYKRIKH